VIRDPAGDLIDRGIIPTMDPLKRRFCILGQSHVHSGSEAAGGTPALNVRKDGETRRSDWVGRNRFRERHEPVHDQANQQHPRYVPRVVVAGHGVEEILEPVDAASQQPCQRAQDQPPNRANQGSTESARSPPSISERDGTLKESRTPKKGAPI
jgi:hypothetical protein